MIFGHEWGDLPIIFTSDGVTSEIIGKSNYEWTKIVIRG